MAGVHAFLPPSGAGSWVHCAMWATMNRLYPQDDSPETLEGNAAHWCFVELFWNRPLSLASVADNGIPVTQEMIDGAQLYVRTVDEHLRERGLDRSVLVVEGRVTMPSVHALNFGTPDTRYGWNRSGLHAFEYKFGHRFVDAYQNWQNIDYLLGMADQIPDFDDLTTPFSLTVVQPRNHDGEGYVRTWMGMMHELRPFRNILAAAADKAVAPNPTATPGAHCYECPGRHACLPLQRSGYKVVWLSKQSVPIELSDDALGNELKLLRDAAEVLKHRIGGLEDDAMLRMTRKGRSVPHFAIEQALGREAWNRPVEDVIAMGKLFGKDLGKPGVLTPKQAKEAGMPAALVDPMIKQETRGLKLVEDDGRKAAKAFGRK